MLGVDVPQEITQTAQRIRKMHPRTAEAICGEVVVVGLEERREEVGNPGDIAKESVNIKHMQITSLMVASKSTTTRPHGKES